MSNGLQQDESRAVDRVPMCLRAEIQAGDGTAAGEVVDLSRDGARVRTSGDWQIGQEIHVSMEMFGSCRGHVIWHKDGAIGIKFAEEFLMLTLLVGGWCSLNG